MRILLLVLLRALCSLSSSYRSQTLLSSPTMWLAGVHSKRESFAPSRNGSTLLAIGRDRCSIGGAPLSLIDTGVRWAGVLFFPAKVPPRCKTCAWSVWHFLHVIDDEQVRGWSWDAMFSRQPSITSGPSCHSSFKTNTLPPPPSCTPPSCLGNSTQTNRHFHHQIAKTH